MPIIGPNCYGFVNYLDGAPLWPDQHGGAAWLKAACGDYHPKLEHGDQYQHAATRPAHCFYAVTAGNQAQIGISAEIGLPPCCVIRACHRAWACTLKASAILRAFEALAAEAQGGKAKA